MDFDFGANTEVKSLDVVPEQFRPLYKEKDGGGGFALNGNDAQIKGAVEAIVNLNKALKAERGVSKDLKSRVIDLTPLSDYGNGVEEIKATFHTKLEELQSQLKGGKEAKLNLDKIKADLAAANAKQTQALEQRNKVLQDQLYDVLVEKEALTHLSDAVDPELVMPFVRKKIKAVEEDGKVTPIVVDDKGDQRYSGLTGGPMTINELVSELKSSEKFAPLFRSKTPSGSGHRPGSASVQSQTQKRQPVNAVDRIRMGLEKRNR